LAQHKGYGTMAHVQAIQQLGPTTIHRLTFRGVVQAGDRDD
jgi:ribonuclease HII